MTIFLLAPAPNLNFVGLPSGSTYTSDRFGIVVVSNGSVADEAALANSGCQVLAAQALDLLGIFLGANMNTVADQIFSGLSNSQKFRPRRITACNASGSLTTAAGGIYTGLGKTGTLIVAAAQAYSSLTGSALALDLTLNVPNAILAPATNLYLSLTTPQGGAMTADFYIYGDKLSQ